MNRRRFLSWLGALGLIPALPALPKPAPLAYTAIELSPSVIPQFLEISAELVAATATDIEAMVKADIAQHMAYGIDRFFVDSVEFDA